MKKKYCRIGGCDFWMPLVDGRLIVNGVWGFTVTALDDDYIEVKRRADGIVWILPVTEGPLSSYEAKMPNGFTFLHCSDSRATIKLT